MPTPPPTSGCGFAGDADSYGLGVRLGAYIQWLTSVIAYNLYDSEAASMRGVNTCFQAAVFIGLVVITTRRAELHAVEAFVVLLFCMGGFFSTLPLPYRFLTGAHASDVRGIARFRPTNAGDLVRNLLGTATCAYGVWFAFVGADRMEQSRIASGCGSGNGADLSRFSPVFVFARVDLYGWARTLLKVLIVLGLVYMAVVLGLSVFAVLKDCYDYVKDWTNVDAEADDDADDAARSERVLQPSWKAVLLSLVGLALLVVAVELTLYWNEVEGVYSLGSTGQVFPLVVGVAGLSRLLWKVGYDYVKGDIRWKPRA
jgi:hypothetical protein